MVRRDYEKTATVRLVTPDGDTLVASAILERDPHYLNWNRMHLLGGRDTMMQAMRLHGAGLIGWELLSERGEEVGSSNKSRTSGTCAFRSVQAPLGSAVADDTIHKCAELDIFEVDTIAAGGGGFLRAEFWFLQRPPGWHVHRRRFSFTDTLTHKGDWTGIASSDLQFRLLSIGYPRTDERISRELEVLQIPGVEIRAKKEAATETFIQDAQDTWFAFRILIGFRFRQLVESLVEMKQTTSEHRAKWHALDVKPRVRGEHADPPLFARSESYLAKGAAALAACRAHRETIHAAVFGYASSYEALSLEGGLTACVEAIERLVSAFEQVRGLDRELLSRRDWRPVAKSLKLGIDALKLKRATADQIKRHLSTPATLSLEQRIERMAHHYRNRWHQAERDLMMGLSGMIKARNAIVHGRLIEDLEAIHIEVLRAQTLFERLFLCFVGGHGFRASGTSHYIITSWQAEKVASAKAENLS
jgi:hypothetical protein